MAQYELNIKLGGIDEAGTEGVFDDFVGGVDAKFAEDVLAVGGDGVYAWVSLVGYLLRCLALGDGFHNLRLRLCQYVWLFLLLLLLMVEDGLKNSLADMTGVMTYGFKGIADVLQRTVLEDDAELIGQIDDATQELWG